MKDKVFLKVIYISFFSLLNGETDMQRLLLILHIASRGCKFLFCFAKILPRIFNTTQYNRPPPTPLQAIQYKTKEVEGDNEPKVK